MTLDPDILVDRRRLKRKLLFWRIAAVVALLAALGALIAATSEGGLGERSRSHIARLTVSGFISEDRKQIELIDKLRRANSVAAVVVAIDSPGGTTAGGEALYEALRRLAAKKPVVATVSGLATSAGYIVALATDRIVVRHNSITGSIGVLAQWPDLSQLIRDWGIRLEEVKSAPLKAEPNPFKPVSPEARAMLQAMIDDSFRWFVGLVAERRQMSPEEARRLADGRVFTGGQALDLKLVDAVGGEETAIAWLESERGVKRGLAVRDWKPSSSGSVFDFSDALARAAIDAIGLKDLVRRGLVLDGLKSLWHGSGLRDAAPESLPE